jgi:hypothetical protein
VTAFIPPEPSLPGAAELLAGGGQECLAGFLRARGWEPDALEPVQLLYRPERSLAVRFQADARQVATGVRASFTLTAECRQGGPPPPPPPPRPARRPGGEVGVGPEGVVRLPAGRLIRPLDDPVAVSGPYLLWAFPYDPSLPGLSAAAQAPLVCRRLSAAPRPLTVEPLRYRPRRRAVLRYRLGQTKLLFAKVLPPARAKAALASARALRGSPPGGLRLALPIGQVGKGALLVRPLQGRCLRTLLLEGARLPAPERLARLSDDLAAAALNPLPGGTTTANTRRRANPATAAQAGLVVTRLLPALTSAAGRLVESIEDACGEDDPVDERIVHGDLYEGQVLVGADQSLGLVDLDDVGLGDPALDAATFCAHLLVLAVSAGAARGRILRYAEMLRRAFLERLAVHPRDLAWREAYAMLLLAPGPVRVLHPEWRRKVTTRIELAQALLA